MNNNIEKFVVGELPPSLEDLIKQRKPLKNINQETLKKVSKLDKLAVWITDRVGTMGFFLIIFCWSVIWLGWNFLAPKELVFDPPMGFVFWLFISNLIQILLMPLIMVGQNIQGLHNELRADHDLKVNVKAEKEIKVILEHLEYQNNLLLQIIGHLKASAFDKPKD
jgi:uncharacterized membrane protein